MTRLDLSTSFLEEAQSLLPVKAPSPPSSYWQLLPMAVQDKKSQPPPPPPLPKLAWSYTPCVCKREWMSLHAYPCVHAHPSAPTCTHALLPPCASAFARSRAAASTCTCVYLSMHVYMHRTEGVQGGGVVTWRATKELNRLVLRVNRVLVSGRDG